MTALKNVHIELGDESVKDFEEAVLAIDGLGFLIIQEGNKRHCYNMETIVYYSYEVPEDKRTGHDLGDNVISFN